MDGSFFWICCFLVDFVVVNAASSNPQSESLNATPYSSPPTEAGISINQSNLSASSCPAKPLTSETNVPLALLIGIVSIVTVGGNALVITSVLIFRKLHRLSNMFVISLATADLIMGGVVMPLGAHYLIGTRWILGHLACDLWTSIDVLTVTASIGTLCAISLDRYVAITKPFRYSKRSTRKSARILIGLVWVGSGAIAFVPIHLGWWKTDEKCDLQCYEDQYCCEFRPNEHYAVVSSLVSFYLPLVVMLFAYSIVFKIAIEKRTDIRRAGADYKLGSRSGSKVFILSRREHRAVFTMGIVMGTFVVCWLPFFIANITQAFCKRCISETTFVILNWLGYTNSFFNPFIYCHSKEFRNAFKRLLLCDLCRNGFDQTSRASLSTSYSRRSSFRSPSTLFQLPSFLANNLSLRKSSKYSSEMRKGSTNVDCTQSCTTATLVGNSSWTSCNREDGLTS